MITKDIKSYLINNYPNYLEAITDMSKSDNDKVLVNDERKLYNFDKKQMSCYEDDEKYCEAYGELFFKNQKNEDKILRNSVQFKAVESYMTFMEEIESKSEEDTKQKSLIYCVVVDDYVDNMEDILNGLAKKSSETNTITSLRQSLSRFCKTEKKGYYYDDVKVFSPYEFKEFVTRNM